MKHLFYLAAILLVLSSCQFIPPKKIWLHDLDISMMEAGWGISRSKLTVDSNQLIVAGKVYENGVGTHAISKMMIDFCDRSGGTSSAATGNKSCPSKAVRFSALVGIDDEANNERASAEFFVIGDQQILWRSGVMKFGDPPRKADVKLEGVKKLALYVSEAGDFNYYDHTDWLEAFIEYRKESPVAISQPVPVAYILTPSAGEGPRINSPTVYGATPGKPFLFRIPVSGRRPMNFSAQNLPGTLDLDVADGIISGTVPDSGTYVVNITVKNAIGEVSRDLKIVTGQGLALTPPMGWNSWNCWGLSVDDAKVRAAADAFISSGLADHGWSYINIDDGWEAPERNNKGEITTNEKFPDMKSLSGYVHSHGLKLGIYSSPGPLTCGGFLGSYEHEKQDVKTWSDWGIDYLKYDWCSYGKIALNDSLDELQKPYLLMDKLLEDAPRDIVYSLCQYGMGNVWEWGREVGGNLWRTTGDITDTWESMAGIGFTQDKCSPYATPGGWNDPDMLVVGKVGWGPNLHPSKLTPDEQYTHISLWCLLSAPLLIGCDLSQLDEFTLNLLTNDEVLAVNQDELGRQAVCMKRDSGYEIWSKTLSDGSVAVGIFNTGLGSPVDGFNWEAGGMPTKSITLNWEDLGLSGVYTVRDLWRQKDIGQFGSVYTAEVPYHGVVLVKLSR
ncbi:MAG TPA: NPCBM/NEW2 domain-containing protein [Bacteroidales bacterium]|nr:NPCBM/NEW2 domain-containing protein [Bacteroidales bacterium]HPI86004.1 NPCBM/NEW2 domain-containing protein [Bacteroidales bacterium]HPM91698.1 NPCBM/NEW2 domain-containing protein [Bacteroidales bacterium]